MFLSTYTHLKEFIGQTLPLSPDALHVHVGLILFLAAAAVMRTERRFIYSLGWLLVLSLIGEVLDLAYSYDEGYRLRWLDSAKDIFNTMFWPAIWVYSGPMLARALRLRVAPIRLDLQGSGK